jgi:tRNA (guanine37-N1)-methyltransferase
VKFPKSCFLGNLGEIAKWRREQSVIRTAERRPELLDKVELSSKEIKLVNEKRKKLSGEE